MAKSQTLTPIEELKRDLRELEPKTFAMQRIFDTVPLLFEEEDEWTQWKIDLAKALDVDAYSIVVIGSGCVGFSLHPDKNLRKFGKASDVDVAVVSNLHFEIAWRYIRDVGAAIYSLPPDAQAAVKEHRREHVFWGTIATDKVLPYVQPFGPAWVRRSQL